MRVLVCGDRYWDDRATVWDKLDDLLHVYQQMTIIEGGCKRWDKERRLWTGADFYAEQWTVRRTQAHEPYPADWDKLGKAAGPIRNAKMLEQGKPDIALAFHDNLEESRGTKDMVERSKAAGLPVYVIGRA